jgi:hypothetical protein
MANDWPGFVADHPSGTIDPANRALRVNLVASDSITMPPVIAIVQPLTFSRGGVLLTPSNPVNVIVWQAPFACTVTALRGYASGAIGTTINARKNGTLTHLASDLTLGSADTWLDGGSVQNTAYSTNDKMEIMLTGIGGAPTQVAVQVDFTRP